MEEVYRMLFRLNRFKNLLLKSVKNEPNSCDASGYYCIPTIVQNLVVVNIQNEMLLGTVRYYKDFLISKIR